MGLITDIQEKLTKIFGFDVFLDLQFGTQKATGVEKVLNLLNNNGRLMQGGGFHLFRLMTKDNTKIISTFTMSEFPACCGKAIVHAIKIESSYYNSSTGGKCTIEDKSHKVLVESSLEIAKEICKILKYSSMDFIVSDIDNPTLYEAMKEIDLKPVSAFRNIRYEQGHYCNHYSITLPKKDESVKKTEAAQVQS